MILWSRNAKFSGYCFEIKTKMKENWKKLQNSNSARRPEKKLRKYSSRSPLFATNFRNFSFQIIFHITDYKTTQKYRLGIWVYNLKVTFANRHSIIAWSGVWNIWLIIF